MRKKVNLELALPVNTFYKPPSCDLTAEDKRSVVEYLCDALQELEVQQVKIHQGDVKAANTHTKNAKDCIRQAMQVSEKGGRVMSAPNFTSGYVVIGPTGIVQFGTNSDTKEESIELFIESNDITERKWLKLEDEGFRCAKMSMRIEPIGGGA